MSHVFISYASEERDLAEEVCAGLERRGLGCWIAPRDIPPGEVYARAIVEAVESCGALVLLLSASANDSDHVFRELELASASGHRVVPVLIGGVRPSRRVRFLIASNQWLETELDALDRSIDAVARALRATPNAVAAHPSARNELGEAPTS